MSDFGKIVKYIIIETQLFQMYVNAKFFYNCKCNKIWVYSISFRFFESMTKNTHEKNPVDKNPKDKSPLTKITPTQSRNIYQIRIGNRMGPRKIKD